ncbi:hypothetical protein Cgig2_021568 [Carnegiea gigantea]|uniref:Microbial collagenase n=1 Tax=Carnegiea gigantea TaxID=171969 RepID=A0A9Q1Q713_9CARY|nr:hypothetical protein Cgig2_021568 [Carnegiea gigantea]
MWSQIVTTAPIPSSTTSSLSWVSPPLFHLQPQANHCTASSFIHPHLPFSFAITEKRCRPSKITIVRASLEGITSTNTSASFLPQQDDEQPKPNKNAAKTRKVPKDEVLSALSVIEKAKLDPLNFLETLGGTKSPGRTWMLIFTAEKKLKGGRYFPFTAVQRFDAEARRIENGVYLGPIGSLTFEGRFSWKKRIMAFIFEHMRIKLGPFNPLEISLGNKDDREPSTKDPFFIWFYVDEEIAVARGRGGGTAFWCRCRRVTTS